MESENWRAFLAEHGEVTADVVAVFDGIGVERVERDVSVAGAVRVLVGDGVPATLEAVGVGEGGAPFVLRWEAGGRKAPNRCLVFDDGLYVVAAFRSLTAARFLRDALRQRWPGTEWRLLFRDRLVAEAAPPPHLTHP